MSIVLQIVAYLLLALCLVSMLAVYAANKIRKQFHFNFKLSEREQANIEKLDIEKREKYQELLLDLKLKRNLLMFAALTGGLSWICFILLHYIYNI